MRVCGPNTAGYHNFGGRVQLAGIIAMDVERVLAGPVGVICQSGSIGGALISRATHRGIGFSYLISCGNEMDLEMADYVDFLVEDDSTRAIEGARKIPPRRPAGAQGRKAHRGLQGGALGGRNGRGRQPHRGPRRRGSCLRGGVSPMRCHARRWARGAFRGGPHVRRIASSRGAAGGGPHHLGRGRGARGRSVRGCARHGGAAHPLPSISATSLSDTTLGSSATRC